MRRSLPLFSALLVLTWVAAGCSGGGDEAGPAATVGTAPVSMEPDPIDPAVIPDDPADIDEGYVQAVVDALFAVDAEATRVFLETGTLDQRGIDHLAAIYVGEELEQQVYVWEETLAGGTDTLLPGALDNEVLRIIDAGEDCVFFEVNVDYSGTTTEEVPATLNYLGITPKDENDPGEVNSTAWKLFTDGVNVDGSEPENPCAGR